MGSDRLYHLDLKAHQAYLKASKDEFPDVVHLQFKPNTVTKLTGAQISHLLQEFGDFQLHKDTQDSCFVDLFMLESSVLLEQQRGVGGGESAGGSPHTNCGSGMPEAFIKAVM